MENRGSDPQVSAPTSRSTTPPGFGPFSHGAQVVVFTSDTTISSLDHGGYTVVVIGCILTVDGAGGPAT